MTLANASGGGTLVLVRHGESVWNLENRFTGWTDVPLSAKGREEARLAGERLKKAGFTFDEVHTSLLSRAILTSNLLLEAMDLLWLPVQRSFRLNERHYGALQGLNKQETADKHGEAQLKVWRRSYDVRPPALGSDDPRQARFDARYHGLPKDVLPSTESLADVLVRMLPYWYDQLAPKLAQGRRLLVVAHGNSLRALVKHLDGISNADIVELNIATGAPRAYHFDAELRVVERGEVA